MRLCLWMQEGFVLVCSSGGDGDKSKHGMDEVLPECVDSYFCFNVSYDMKRLYYANGA